MATRTIPITKADLHVKALNQNTWKFALLEKGEEKYIPILQQIKGNSL